MDNSNRKSGPIQSSVRLGHDFVDAPQQFSWYKFHFQRSESAVTVRFVEQRAAGIFTNLKPDRSGT